MLPLPWCEQTTALHSMSSVWRRRRRITGHATRRNSVASAYSCAGTAERRRQRWIGRRHQRTMRAGLDGIRNAPGRRIIVRISIFLLTTPIAITIIPIVHIRTAVRRTRRIIRLRERGGWMVGGWGIAQRRHGCQWRAIFRTAMMMMLRMMVVDSIDGEVIIMGGSGRGRVGRRIGFGFWRRGMIPTSWRPLLLLFLIARVGSLALRGRREMATALRRCVCPR